MEFVCMSNTQASCHLDVSPCYRAESLCKRNETKVHLYIVYTFFFFFWSSGRVWAEMFIN
jgi:hypothetical protein